jgi:hypothetical protein
MFICKINSRYFLYFCILLFHILAFAQGPDDESVSANPSASKRTFTAPKPTGSKLNYDRFIPPRRDGVWQQYQQAVLADPALFSRASSGFERGLFSDVFGVDREELAQESLLFGKIPPQLHDLIISRAVSQLSDVYPNVYRVSDSEFKVTQVRKGAPSSDQIIIKERVFDAPGLVPDFYRNYLSVTASHIAVVLGNIVFLANLFKEGLNAGVLNLDSLTEHVEMLMQFLQSCEFYQKPS